MAEIKTEPKEVAELMEKSFNSFYEEIANAVRREVGEGDAYRNGRYPYIQFHRVKELVTELDWLRRELNVRRRHPSFLDCGCGPGLTLHLAEDQGFEAKGVELVDGLIEMGKILGNRERIEKGDLLKYEGYGNFDVLYYYCPMEDVKLQVTFERRVEDQMKVGAFLIPKLKRDRVIEKDSRFKVALGNEFNPRIWQKVEDSPRPKELKGPPRSY